MIDFPNVNFGLISSKHDVIQMSYHDLVSAVACDPNDMVASVAECPLYGLDSARFYQEAIIRFLRPYSQLGNFVSYIVTGHQHTFTGIPIFYNAALSGPCPPDEESDGCLRTSCDKPGVKLDIISGEVKECSYEPHPQDPPTSDNLFEWFKSFPLSADVVMDSCQQQSKCDGDLKDPGEALLPEGLGAAYCDKRLSGVTHKCDEGPQTDMQCDPFALWPDLDQTCVPAPPSRDGECRAKVHTNGGLVVNGGGKFDNCYDYCWSFGHYCVHAAEDVTGGGCDEAYEKSCFHHFRSTTSDMICGCASEHPPGECLPPADWDPNFLDDACGDCTAKVHTKGKDGTIYRSCDMICDSIGHVCTHAAEDNNFGHCQEKNDNFRCSDDIGAMEDTSDFMCQCKYPAPTTTQPTTTPVPTTQPTTTPAPQPTTQHPPGECLPPADWDPNFLDDACGDCTAKVHTKGKDGTYYRSCDMICDSIGHVCTHAAEDANFGHCQEKNDNFRCSDDIGAMEDTSDFM